MSQLNSMEVPRIDVSKKDQYEELLQKYGAADFRQIVQRNIEKDYIERQAALLSVAETASVFTKLNGLIAVMNAAAKGGVIAQFPIEGGIGDTGRDTVNAPLVAKQVVLDRANVTYRILHEAMMEGGSLAEDDSIAEGVEQLGAKMDNHYLTGLKTGKHDPNDVTAAATWTSTGNPFDDINTMINNIITNSGVNPNSKADSWFTVIAPIAARVALERIQIVDGIKISTSELIKSRLGAQVIYSRPPFNLDNITWPISTEAIVIPTKDRHVGKFYTFDGGDMPSIFTTVDENGKRVSTNSWMKFVVSPSEADGSLTESRRIGVISNVA